MVAWQTGAAQAPKGNADPYLRWVNEDIVYMIGANERKAFVALKTNDERKRFIEQFWQRRDPTPGTDSNEFQEEHYRRIAYAGQRFGLGGSKGWRTDRGRIYIIYGPPDEIETHPNGRGWSAVRAVAVLLSGRRGQTRHRGVCGCEAGRGLPADDGSQKRTDYSFSSDRRRLVWTRLTGISVCFLSSIFSWNDDLNHGITSRMRLMLTR